MILKRLTDFIFPPKCILCGGILQKSETDLCHDCRGNTEEFTKSNKKISFVAGWTALWYYNGKVRKSILRYKFYGRRHYGAVYGRLLAMKLLQKSLSGCDLITWVPVSKRRQFRRGYDQTKLIAVSAAQELQLPAAALLHKSRHTKPQSRLIDPSHRRANVLGAFTVTDPKAIAGKRILLLDDIITTGATASECAKVLLSAGAKEVYCAAVAASYDKSKKTQVK